MSSENVTISSRAKGWLSQIMQLAGIVLAVFLAKGAIAEPFYVPSGSMEPTLQIGDELLATKFPYGYSSASLPIFVTLPDTPRILGSLPRRGVPCRPALPRFYLSPARLRYRCRSLPSEERDQAAAPAAMLHFRRGALEHDPEKWTPVFRKDHAPPKTYRVRSIQPEAIAL